MKKLELNDESLEYLRKAELVLKNPENSRVMISKKTGIPYATVRKLVSEPERLEHTRWSVIMLLAQLFDELTNQ